MKRLGIIVAAGTEARANPVLGERDACLVSDRLGVADMGFEVAVVDPAVDLAEQLDRILNEAGPVDDLFVYASVLVDVDLAMDAFFCLDPAQPEIGDAVENVASALEEFHTGACLMVVEGRFSDSQADNRTIEEVCDSVVKAFEPQDAGPRSVELVVSMRPKDAHAERIPSRFTAALLEELDTFSAAATARKAYANAVQHAHMGEWPHALRYVPADRASLSLLPPDPASFGRRAPAETAPSPAPPAEKAAAEKAAAEKAAAEKAAAEKAAAEKAAAEKAAAEKATAAGAAPEPPTPAGMKARTGPHAVAAAEPATSSRPKKRKPRRPAPPSERVASASVTVAATPPPTAATEAQDGLPKVVIAKAADPRQRDTERRADRKAIVAEAQKLIAAGLEEQEEGVLPPVGGLDVDFDDDISLQEIPPAAPDKPPPKKPSGPPYLNKPESEWEVGDCIDAGDAKLDADDVDAALALFKRALGKLGTTSSPQRAEVYIRMAQVMHKRGKLRVAISNYDKALGIVPNNIDALRGVIELQVEQGNWRAVKSCEAKFFGNDDVDEAALFDELLASGTRWLDQEPTTAEQRFVQASAVAPDRTEPLQRLVVLYTNQNKVELALDVEEKLARRLASDTERARALKRFGELCFEHDFEQRAYGAYMEALEADPFYLEALEALATACADAQEWGELENAYLKMSDLLAARGEQQQTRAVLAEIFHRLALLYRDHLFDPQSALEFLEKQMALVPPTLKLQLLAAEVSEEVSLYKRQLAHLRVAAALKPSRVATYESIFRAAQGNDDLEQAFLAASALQSLGATSGPAHYIYQEHAVDGVPAIQRAMGAQGWVWLRVSDRDPAVDRVMRALAPAVLRARVGQLHREGKLADPPGERQSPESSSISAVRSLVWGCTFLGVPMPAIHLDPDQALAYHAPFAKHRTTIVGKGALSGRSMGELAFLVGRHLALRLPEHELVAHMQSIEELTACFLAGLKITLGKTPPHSEDARVVDALAAMLQRELLPKELDYLKDAVRQFSAGSGRVDLRQWVLSVEKCVTRAGYVLCGDLEVAAELTRADGDTPFSNSDDRVTDLLVFSQSEAHRQLRAAFGCAIDG